MTIEDICRTLGEVKHRVIEIPRRKPSPQNPDVKFPEEIIASLSSRLEIMPEFSFFRDVSLKRISGGNSLNYKMFARAILERLSQNISPEIIMNDLVNFSRLQTYTGHYLAGINGITLDDKIRLSDSVEIITSKDLPPGSVRENIFRIDKFERILGGGHEKRRPYGALQISNNQPIFIPRGEPGRRALSNCIKMDEIRSLEQRVLLSITLASQQAAPEYTNKTSYIDHPVNGYYGIGGGSYGSSENQYSLRLDDFDATHTQTLFNDILHLRGDEKNVLFLAIDRLRRSRMQREPVDRAIDLGIALEMIFQYNNSGRQETTYKTAFRMACFLGTSFSTRSSIFEAVKTAYSARSSAVHNGIVKKKKELEILPVADKLCCQAALKIISNGGFPENWEDQIFVQLG